MENDKFQNIILGKVELRPESRDLDTRYVQIKCLLCVLDHEIGIIR